MPATLRLLSGPEAGRLYEFGETEIVIGRDKKSCFVVLEKPEISRNHARVYFQGGRYWLKRTGRNLTFLERHGSREKRVRGPGRWGPHRDLRPDAGVSLRFARGR